MKYERYQKFRQETYQMLGKAKSSTVEIEDYKLGKLKISQWDDTLSIINHADLLVWAFVIYPTITFRMPNRKFNSLV